MRDVHVLVTQVDHHSALREIGPIDKVVGPCPMPAARNGGRLVLAVCVRSSCVVDDHLQKRAGAVEKPITAAANWIARCPENSNGCDIVSILSRSWHIVAQEDISRVRGVVPYRHSLDVIGVTIKRHRDLAREQYDVFPNLRYLVAVQAVDII